VTINAEMLLRDLETANVEALRVYKANKASGSGIESTAFDSGRYEGLKQAIKIVAASASSAGPQENTEVSSTGATFAQMPEEVGQNTIKYLALCIAQEAPTLAQIAPDE
jgi:hypothetical protein